MSHQPHPAAMRAAVKIAYIEHGKPDGLTEQKIHHDLATRLAGQIDRELCLSDLIEAVELTVCCTCDFRIGHSARKPECYTCSGIRAALARLRGEK